MAGKRRIINGFDLREISSVTIPAQEGALKAIIKSAVSPISAALKKAAEQAPADISKHILALSDAFASGLATKGIEAAAALVCSEIQRGKEANKDALLNFTKALVAECVKPDALALEPAGKVKVAAYSLIDAIEAAQTNYLELLKMEKELADLRKANEALVAELATAKADLEKATAAAAEAIAKAALLEKSGDEAFTFNGTEIRKSAVGAPVFTAMKAMRDEAETKGFETEAATVLKSMPGEISAKGALLRAVSEIKNENTRKAAQTILAAGANAFEELLTSKGSGKPGDKPADAEAAFEKGVKEYMKSESIKSDISGRAAFMKTDEGKVLYKAYADEQHLKSKAA